MSDQSLETHFDPLLVDLVDVCVNTGDSHALSGDIHPLSYVVGSKSFRILVPLHYEAIFTNTGDGILVSGLLHTQVEGLCDRCLEPAVLALAAELDAYYLFEASHTRAQEDESLDVLGEDRVLNLASVLHAALVMETPFVVLCQDECKGLCPRCGANLNLASCACSKRAPSDEVVSKESPFAALRALKFD